MSSKRGKSQGRPFIFGPYVAKMMFIYSNVFKQDNKIRFNNVKSCFTLGPGNKNDQIYTHSIIYNSIKST